MTTFSDKPNFSLKQVATAVSTALLIGIGIARFEYNNKSIQNQLITITNMLSDRKKEVDDRFLIVENRVTTLEQDLKAVTTSLTAFIRPEDVTIKERK